MKAFSCMWTSKCRRICPEETNLRALNTFTTWNEEWPNNGFSGELGNNCEKISLPSRLLVTPPFLPHVIVLTFIMACWVTACLCKVSLWNEGSFCWTKEVFGKWNVWLGFEAERWCKCRRSLSAPAMSRQCPGDEPAGAVTEVRAPGGWRVEEECWMGVSVPIWRQSPRG